MEPRDDVREQLLQIQRKLGHPAVASATNHPVQVAPQPFHTLPGAESLPTIGGPLPLHRPGGALPGNPLITSLFV